MSKVKEATLPSVSGETRAAVPKSNYFTSQDGEENSTGTYGSEWIITKTPDHEAPTCKEQVPSPDIKIQGHLEDGSATGPLAITPVPQKLPPLKNIKQLITGVDLPKVECWQIEQDWMTMMFKGDPGYWALSRVGNIFCLWRIACSRLYDEYAVGFRPAVTLDCLPHQAAATYKHLYDSWYYLYFLSHRAKKERQAFCRLFGQVDDDGTWRFSSGVQELIEVARKVMRDTGDLNRVKDLFSQIALFLSHGDANWVPTYPDAKYDSRCICHGLKPRPDIPCGGTVFLCDVERTVGRAPRWRTVDPVPSTRINMSRPVGRAVRIAKVFTNERAGSLFLPAARELEDKEAYSGQP